MRTRTRWMLAAALLAAPLTALAEDAKPAKPKVNVFSGQVVGAEDGKPIEGAKVVAYREDGGFAIYAGPDDITTIAPSKRMFWLFKKTNGGRSAEGTTDENGRFTFKSLESGAYNLIVVHKEKGIRFVDSVEQPNANPVVVKLEKPGFIEGTIKGLSKETQLTLEPQDETDFGGTMLFALPVERDKDGAFKSGPLPPNKWKLKADKFVKKQAYPATVFGAPFNLKAGGRQSLAVDLTQGKTLEGEVRGPKNQPLSGVSVIARDAKTGLQVGAVTGKDGKYAIKGLSGTEYYLDATRHAVRTGPG